MTLKPLLLPAFLGLLAGIGHGIVSHQADLPLSLTEQFFEPFLVSQSFQD